MRFGRGLLLIDPWLERQVTWPWGVRMGCKSCILGMAEYKGHGESKIENSILIYSFSFILNFFSQIIRVMSSEQSKFDDRLTTLGSLMSFQLLHQIDRHQTQPHSEPQCSVTDPIKRVNLNTERFLTQASKCESSMHFVPNQNFSTQPGIATGMNDDGHSGEQKLRRGKREEENQSKSIPKDHIQEELFEIERQVRGLMTDGDLLQEDKSEIEVKRQFESLLHKFEGIIDEIEKRGVICELPRTQSQNCLRKQKEMGICHKVVEVSLAEGSLPASSKKLRKKVSCKTLSVYSSQKGIEGWKVKEQRMRKQKKNLFCQQVPCQQNVSKQVSFDIQSNKPPQMAQIPTGRSLSVNRNKTKGLALLSNKKQKLKAHKLTKENLRVCNRPQNMARNVGQNMKAESNLKTMCSKKITLVHRTILKPQKQMSKMMGSHREIKTLKLNPLSSPTNFFNSRRVFKRPPI